MTRYATKYCIEVLISLAYTMSLVGKSNPLPWR